MWPDKHQKLASRHGSTVKGSSALAYFTLTLSSTCTCTTCSLAGKLIWQWALPGDLILRPLSPIALLVQPVCLCVLFPYSLVFHCLCWQTPNANRRSGMRQCNVLDDSYDTLCI